MSETWLISATRWTGPVHKQGYSQIAVRSLADIKGEVKHSMVGSFTAAMARLNGPDLASWTFSVTKIGEIYQHYPLEAVTWHGGGPEVNQSYIGVEHEGGPPGNESEPLSEPQYQATLALTQELRALLPHLGPPSRLTNLREHNELAATACPSNRIPWDRLIADLSDTPASGDLAAEVARLAKLLRDTGLDAGNGNYRSVTAIDDAVRALVRVRAAHGHKLPTQITSKW